MSDEEKPKVIDDEDILVEMRERFALCVDMDSENREEALDDLKFLWNVDGYQWPQEAKDVRIGRPMLTENRLPQFARLVVNGIRKNRPAISVIPADAKAEKAIADVKEGLVRHIEQHSRADLAYDNAAFYAVASSVGYYKVTTEYVDGEGFDQEICLRPVDNPFTIYDDPFCKMPDKSDRRFCFETEMVKRKDFKAEYGFEPADFSELAGLGDDMKQWMEEDSVRVANYWRIVKKKTKVYRFQPEQGEPIVIKPDDKGKYLYEGEEVPPDILKGFESRDIETSVVEPYLCTGDKIIKRSKWRGKYIPIVAVIGEEVNIEGKKRRKSLIRDAKDSQKANNYYLSAEAEIVALTPKTPWIGEQGAFDVDTQKWETANTKNWSYIQYARGRAQPQRNYANGFPDGIRQARMAAIEGMKAVLGLYDASLGARSNETSGIALEERQKQGDNATFHFPDNMNRAIRYGGMVVLDLQPHVYDASRVVRILSAEGEAEMKAINSVFVDAQGKFGSIAMDRGTYECVVKAGPSHETQRIEEREHVINLTKVMPQLTQVAPDLIMDSMDFHNSDKYAERLKRTVPPNILGEGGPQGLPPEVQQAMAQVQQAQQQVQEAGAQLQAEQAATDKDKAANEVERAKIDSARAQLKAAEDTLVSKYEELSAKLELQAMKTAQVVPPTMPDVANQPAIAPGT